MTTDTMPVREDEQLKLKDKVAVITGSGRGIGRSIAEAFLRAGAKVVISDINQDTCNQTAKELKDQGGETLGVVCDVTKTESVDALVEAVTKEWGRVDILVNNAGITRDNLIMRMNEDEWQAVIDTNLTSAFKVSKAVLKVMSKQ